MKEELFRAEFGREAVNATDQPLHFMLQEVLAVMDRGVPVENSILLSAATKVVITITVE